MRILSIILLFAVSLGMAQELPPVINFDPNQYMGGNQNWMISQTPNGNMYIANSTGLLEYTGEEWNLYPMPNNTIVRSVEVVGERVYAGAYMEIGYWERTGTGRLEYSSLLSQFPDPLRDGEQFWHIRHLDDFLIFQSFEGLYLYNEANESITKIPGPPAAITNLFKAGDDIFFQVMARGLYTIRGNVAQQVIAEEFLQQIEVMHITRKGSDLILISRNGMIYSWDGDSLEAALPALTGELQGKSVFSALDLEDGTFLLGTVEDGIFHLDKEGALINRFNQENGLLNNTVLHLYVDREQNIWAGLDHGLAVINLESSFRSHQDIYGKLGSVYASFQTNTHLYLGTNQGLFFRRIGENGFEFMEGTNGQVWNLQFIDGYLFAGHNNGTFLIEAENATRIFDRTGTWTISKTEGTPGFYVQGHYNGLSLLREIDGEFKDLGMLEDFPHSSKFIVQTGNDEFWTVNEHKGIFRLKLDFEKQKLNILKNFSFDTISGINSSIFKFNDSLYFSSRERLLKYDPEEENFKPDSGLSEIFNTKELISGKVITTGDGRIWGFSENTIFNVEVSGFSNTYRENSIYLPRELRNITLGYENISFLPDDSYLLGISNGYLKFEEEFTSIEDYELRINQITASALDAEPHLLDLENEEPFHYKTNNITFKYSIPVFKKFYRPEYSYRLLGLSSQWSPWSQNSVVSFTNLPFGDYEFEVRGRIGDKYLDPVLYSFQISRPWYLSFTALTVYFLFFILLVYLINKLYKRKHQKVIRENEKELRMKNLEAEKRIIELQNEQLERDMESKNKELAVSTMSLIKKNEFLSSIKEKLKDSRASGEVSSVIKTIDKDISEEDNWKFFKEAFNNADKDFFKKIKSRHPNLTANDLKLCAYLRLNLTSKEIAPLLNISVKSVEIKRYRLRKKMDLEHDVNLVDYILAI
ncbi:histidine kinase [Antarcticibacterium flavum]|uniref:Histidine kinase n=1 Tax=Antarcticibacterium flavum TaxID=2058175 RepID=A0A5B7X205_9FLAO|nr:MULTISPECIES: triple tyrosine motif-containing protein [Antarcticibacterium]MCM4161362.1 histidine kinase [Antarcticibacterium sp. W02-3]QCY69437.1 histidine kinase [Antarcticibacterium flavum]